MFCSNCGKEVQPDAKFCPYCGTPIKIGSTAKNSDDRKNGAGDSRRTRPLSGQFPG